MTATAKPKIIQLDANVQQYILDTINNNKYLWQVVQNHVTTTFTYVYTAVRANMVELACLTTSITTLRDNTRVQFDALISGEIYQDSVFVLKRVVGGVETEIGSYTGVAGNRYYGIVGATYEPDNQTTMNQNKIQYIDSPAVDADTTLSYKIYIYGTASTAYINRTVYDDDVNIRERATSNVRLSEIK